MFRVALGSPVVAHIRFWYRIIAHARGQECKKLLDVIQASYDIEQRAKSYSIDERHALRQNDLFLRQLLSHWQLPRLPNWNDQAIAAVSEKELEALRNRVNRGRPYGCGQCAEKIAEQQGVWHTLRPIGRPRKQEKPSK